MKLAWLTDIHLNFLGQDECSVFYQTIKDAGVDVVLISGDIAEAPSIQAVLSNMADATRKPIYFVLGNHDYYGGSIKSVRKTVTCLTQTIEPLKWLSILGPQKFLNDVLLMGVDGFADGRYGDYEQSSVSLNDSLLIAEFFQAKLLSRKHLLSQMQKFADEDARRLLVSIEEGIEASNPKKIIVLTHVPPFSEVCFYESRPTHSHYLPFFASKATGDVLFEIAERYPLIEFTVLSGHTHHAANHRILPNLNVKVGEAKYYVPKIQEIIQL